MSLSDPNQQNDLDSAYRQIPPWDVGVPQPELIVLFDEFPPTVPVLDVGCGTGELSLAVAARGLKVLGVDLASTAIDQARAKLTSAAPEVSRWVEFRVGDALHPAQFSGPFNAVIDSGFFHLFGPQERTNFVKELEATLNTGGRYYLLGFAFDSPMPHAPKQVREDELRTLFTPKNGWRVLMLRPAKFVIRSPRGNEVPAIAACFERV